MSDFHRISPNPRKNKMATCSSLQSEEASQNGVTLQWYLLAEQKAADHSADANSLSDQYSAPNVISTSRNGCFMDTDGGRMSLRHLYGSSGLGVPSQAEVLQSGGNSQTSLLENLAHLLDDVSFPQIHYREDGPFLAVEDPYLIGKKFKRISVFHCLK